MVGTGALMVPGDVLEWSCAIVVREIPVPSADPFLLSEHKRMPPAENSQRQLLQHLGCDIREFCRVWPCLNQVSESLVADYADYVASPPFRIKALGADGKISVPNIKVQNGRQIHLKPHCHSMELVPIWDQIWFDEFQPNGEPRKFQAWNELTDLIILILCHLFS